MDLNGGMRNMTGKESFYHKAGEALAASGFAFVDGDDMKGRTRAHARRPDYVAANSCHVVIGETKSPAEPPTNGSWRQRQKNDTEAMAAVRARVQARERSGQVSREVGGHEIILCGQIPDYVANIGVTFDLPFTLDDRQLIGGYSVPATQHENVRQAFVHCGLRVIQEIDTGNGSVTFLFDLPATPRIH